MLLLSTLSAILFTLNSYIWNILFLLLKPFGLHLFQVYGDKVLKFKKNVSISSSIRDDEPYGLVLGKYYIGYIEYVYHTQSYEWCISILTTKSIYKKLFHGYNYPDTKENSKEIRFYEKEGPYYNIRYNYRPISFHHLIPNKNQKKILDSIIKYYDQNNNAIVLIYGPINTGKSCIPLLLANRLIKQNNINVIDTFNPTEPGDHFGRLYSKISPDQTNPLIVVIDEIDTLLDKIHNNLVMIHKDNPIQIKNKLEWNQFFDRFDRKLYPWVILIMTSNKYPSYFDNLDSSYFREGRVNLKFELNESKSKIFLKFE